MGSQLTFVASVPDDLDEPARALQTLSKSHRVFAFYGPMGVGKTTLIKVFCTLVGVTDEMSSPTFSLVNEYHLPEGSESIYHFDFYRIEKQEEAFDMGYEDYFYGGNLCLIEWPEKIDGLLPEKLVKVELTEDNGKRLVTITH